MARKEREREPGSRDHQEQGGAEPPPKRGGRGCNRVSCMRPKPNLKPTPKPTPKSTPPQYPAPRRRGPLRRTTSPSSATSASVALASPLLGSHPRMPLPMTPGRMPRRDRRGPSRYPRGRSCRSAACKRSRRSRRSRRRLLILPQTLSLRLRLRLRSRAAGAGLPLAGLGRMRARASRASRASAGMAREASRGPGRRTSRSGAQRPGGPGRAGRGGGSLPRWKGRGRPFGDREQESRQSRTKKGRRIGSRQEISRGKGSVGAWERGRRGREGGDTDMHTREVDEGSAAAMGQRRGARAWSARPGTPSRRSFRTMRASKGLVTEDPSPQPPDPDAAVVATAEGPAAALRSHTRTSPVPDPAKTTLGGGKKARRGRACRSERGGTLEGRDFLSGGEMGHTVHLRSAPHSIPLSSSSSSSSSSSAPGRKGGAPGWRGRGLQCQAPQVTGGCMKGGGQRGGPTDRPFAMPFEGGGVGKRGGNRGEEIGCRST